jgi:hypothetical protein
MNPTPMSNSKISSIVLAIATVLSSGLLALTGHISWSEASPIILGGLSILGVHPNI